MLRKPRFLALLSVLLKPISTVKAALLEYRQGVLAAMEPNGQTMSLEWHLNNLYDSNSRRIYIVTSSELVVQPFIYNSGESGTAPFVYDHTETPTSQMYLFTRAEYFTSNFFIVYVPAVVYSAAIHTTIKAYKLAGTKYKIIQT